jgi:adenylate cyclase
MTLSELCDAEGERIGALIMIEDVSREKRLKSTMSRYMDSGIAEQLLGQGSEVLGGRDLVATILFSDVRSFTTLTEELGAQGTVKMLNEYFTIMVDCIQAEGGMLDKFIGDAIMAGFGLPMSHDDDEDRAMRCAIAMHRELNLWNKEREKRGDRPLHIGIGLNTDKVVAGNIGSPKRMDYTMIGDGVNLAARLESASKQYCAGLLISEFTKAKLKGTYRLREVDSVVVKGKTEPVKIHEVLDFYTEEEFPNVHDVLAHFQRARHHYLAQRWDDAIQSFKDTLKANPNDGLAKLYIERCELMKANPPAADWDGVWTLTSK